MCLNKKILIIDDDSRNIFALKAVLKAKGFTCLSAVSAKEGMDLMQSDDEIKLVLMDMMMPEMDGYEAMRAIKDIEAIAGVPVIAVTAQAMVGDR
ncbi:MAG: response regulator, partial [Daejeonella sp.]